MATGIVPSGGAPKTGIGACGSNGAQETIGYLGLPIGTELDMSDAAALRTLIGNGTAFTIKGNLFTYEQQNEEAPVIEGAAGYRQWSRDGKARDLYTIQAPIGVLNQLSELSKVCQNYDFIRIQADGRLEGHHYDTSANTLQGFTSSAINAATVTPATAESKAAKALSIDYSTPSQMNDHLALVNPDFNVLGIDGISVTFLSLEGATSVTVAYDSGEYSSTEKSLVYGLEDEFVESTTGAPITGITEAPANSGIYTGFTSGAKPTLSDPADQTEDLRYWAKNNVTIA